MAQFELVKFIDPNDGEETFAQFADDRKLVSIYSSESIARRWFKVDDDMDDIEEAQAIPGYAEAVEAALEGEVIATA